MWTRLVDWLACPKCQSYPLQLIDAKGAGERIDAGAFLCPQCHTRYPILQGVPSFVGSSSLEVEDPAGAQESRFGTTRGLQMAERQFRDTNYYRSFDRRELEIRLALELESARNGVCLDLGCGSGDIFWPMVAKERTLIGIDFSWNSLQYLQSRFPHAANVHLVHADAMALPLRPAIFDSAISLQMLEQIPGEENRQRVVRNVARVLKRDGLFILSVFHYSLLKRLRAPTLRSLSDSVYEKEGLHKGFLYYLNFTLDELDELLERNFVRQRVFGVETPLSHRLDGFGMWLEGLVVRTPVLVPFSHLLVVSYVHSECLTD